MSKLRLIQCGVGGHGTSWVKTATTISPDFTLVAVVDVAAANIEATREFHRLPPERCFTSLEAALCSVEADAVLTVTPPAVHLAHARLAFERGLHLITEKPIADTVANAREMVKLASAAGRQLVVSQNYRFSAPLQKLKSLLAEREVGELGHGDVRFYIPADVAGTFRAEMAHVMLVDMAVHHFDLLRCLTGRDIAAVTARSFRPSWSWFGGESALEVLFELEGGMPFIYSGDCSGSGRCTGWSGDWRLQCAAGSIHLQRDALQVVRCERRGRAETITPVEVPPLPLCGLQATLSLFAQSVRSAIPAEISGSDNIKTFAAVMAAVTSAEERRRVEVAEMLV